MTNHRLLTRGEVLARVGLSTSTIYEMMRRGAFPRPLRVGQRAVRWRSDEIDAWIADLPRGGGEMEA